MDPKRGNLHQLSDAQRVQLVDTLEPIIAEILDVRAEEHPISFGDILLRKVDGRYELGVNFWPKDETRACLVNHGPLLASSLVEI